MMSTIGVRSSLRSAMYMRGMSGKWNAMWHSSPSPKYGRTSVGHWFASARKMRFVELRVERRAQLLQHVVRLGQILAVRALALDEIRNRVEPQAVDADVAARSASRSMTASRTSGLSKLRSG